MSGEEGRQVATPPASITAEDLAQSMERVKAYVQPYQRLLPRAELREHLLNMLVGVLSALERKSAEPIAVLLGLTRRGLQHFLGGSLWDWVPLKQQQQREVAAEIGIPEGTILFDGSSTPKKGEATVGVARQWCGRLGKVDNCVVGVYATYVGKDDAAALVDSRLYLPKAWTKDKARRKAAAVPKALKYQAQPAIALDMLKELASSGLPFTNVGGDDEFGRVRALRDGAAALHLNYTFDVPANTSVRLKRKNGSLSPKPVSAKNLVNRRPVSDWQRFHLRDGEKAPIEVRALLLPVATERVTRRKGRKQRQRTWVEETLVVSETLDGSQRWYCLAKAPEGTPLLTFLRRLGQRHRIEEVFEEAKGEVGMDHYEVRSWQGWHHHMTVSQIAHWFLAREKRRLGGKSSGPHRQHDSNGDSSSADAGADAGEPSPVHQLPPDSQPRSPRSPLLSQRPAASSVPAHPVSA